MSPIKEIRYKDELLADQTVCRRYANGRVEWRTRIDEARAQWRDNLGAAGTDEVIGEGIVKRSYADGRVIYGREQGYGRTLWSEGNLLTINETSFKGQAGKILAAMSGGLLLGSLIAPPMNMTPAEEAAIRQRAAQQQQQQQQSSSGSSSGSTGGDGGDIEIGEDESGWGDESGGGGDWGGEDSDFG